MDIINLNDIGSKAVYYENIDKDKMHNYNMVNLSNFNKSNSKETLELVLQEQLGNKIRGILDDSKENIKDTVPIINNVNKQLMQDNLLMKIKIENMKQVSKNISNYFLNLQTQTGELKNEHIHNLINDILRKLNAKLENTEEE